MSKKFIAGILIIFLLSISIIQIVIDFDFENKSFETGKQSQYIIFIEIEDKKLYLLQDGKYIKQYPIASGMPGMSSPVGSWLIVNKDDWGEGFGGRWMGLNVPWGKYGIHGTIFNESIGRAASHGCIRMFSKDVKELYSIVPVGTPVIILNGNLGPFGNKFREIMPGDRGADVAAIQKRLKELGYFKGWISGIYEDDLKLAVLKFQKEYKLEVKNAISKKDWLAMGFKEFE